MDINAALVGRLVREQFPQWAELPIKPVDLSGWDNRTFHLGSAMTVRLPSAEAYIQQVTKEQEWLPRLAPLLPLPIPVPVAMGVPTNDYPWPWSIYRWIAGENASHESINDMSRFAVKLAGFLAALQRIDAAGGPPPGPHNFFRGGPLAIYDTETRQAITALGSRVGADAVLSVWDTALQATWHSPAVWVHGDVSAGNLLVKQGELCAVIDFGCMGVGDPACDLTIAWTLFSGKSRKAFCAGVPADEATWARGRGWALWKGLITLAEYADESSFAAENARRVIDEVLADHSKKLSNLGDNVCQADLQNESVKKERGYLCRR